MDLFKYIANMNSHMLFPISENLAILPYVIRAIRIRKLFACREIYCNEDKMPKQKIQGLSEKRMLMMLGLFMMTMLFGSIVLFMTDNRFFTFASIDNILDDDDDGSFISSSAIETYISYGCLYMTV